jgi:hypothetical protein
MWKFSVKSSSFFDAIKGLFSKNEMISSQLDELFREVVPNNDSK